MTTPLETLHRVPFFAGLDAATDLSLADAVQQLRVAAGETVIEQGDAGDALFVVVHGRFVVEHTSPLGTRRLKEIGPGEMLGEMAMLSAEPRSATVRALRDSEVIQLTRAAFDHLVQRHPELMRRLATLLANRLRTSNQPEVRARVFRTVALVPHTDAFDAAAFAKALQGALSPLRETHVLTAQTAPGGLALEQPDARDHLLALVNAKERDAQTLLLVTGPGLADWNRFVLAQADLIVVVGAATDAPAAGALERSIAPSLLARRELVLLHAPGTEPAGTRHWLGQGRFQQHHHLRAGDAQHLGRLARWLAGQSLGVVFGGGGARGFAHIGVVRALAEAGHVPDRVGGTSMGSIIAAEVALGWDWQTMLERTRHAFRRDPLKRDNTLPLASLITCRRVVRMFQELFGDARAEDCWLPYFNVVCNLTRAEAAICRDGLLWQRIRGSSALPGIGPPVIENGEFFVDGAVLNNVPGNILLEDAAGPVIAINVSPREDLRTVLPDNYSLSGWRLLWDRLRGRKGAKEYPSMLWVLQRTVLLGAVSSAEKLQHLVSLYLHPPVDHFDMFGWSRVDEIAQVGWESSRAPIEEWARKLGAPR